MKKTARKINPRSMAKIVIINISFLTVLLFWAVFPAQIPAEEHPEIGSEEHDFPEYPDWDDGFGEDETVSVRDPLEPANRMFFQFNDKLYFWFLKPVSKTYGEVVPRDFRLSLRNFYNNLLAPVDIINDFLQGKFGDGSLETCRFVINSTVGIIGMADAAKEVFGLNSPGREDLGQTMGYYGIGNALYICWPFLGPSTLRDTVGMAGDAFLRPDTYVTSGSSSAAGGAFVFLRHVNYTSLNIGEYDDFLAATFDPYLAMRDAYIQQRSKMIKK